MDYSRNGLGLSRSFILSLLWEKQRPVFLSIEIVKHVCKPQPNILRGNESHPTGTVSQLSLRPWYLLGHVPVSCKTDSSRGWEGEHESEK